MVRFSKTDTRYVRVIDASVAMEFYLQDELAPIARAFMRRLTDNQDTTFHVPSHFFAECCNVLARSSRRITHSDESARRDLKEILEMDLEVTDTNSLATDALEIALQLGISGYDSFYVALSLQVGAPLVTADARLARGLKQRGVPVELLGES